MEKKFPTLQALQASRNKIFAKRSAGACPRCPASPSTLSRDPTPVRALGRADRGTRTSLRLVGAATRLDQPLASFRHARSPCHSCAHIRRCRRRPDTSSNITNLRAPRVLSGVALPSTPRLPHMPPTPPSHHPPKAAPCGAPLMCFLQSSHSSLMLPSFVLTPPAHWSRCPHPAAPRCFAAQDAQGPDFNNSALRSAATRNINKNKFTG